MSTIQEKQEQQREYFKNHVAKYWNLTREGSPQVEMIRFQEPGTNNYFIEFLFTNETLFVRGDLGEAVYCWHHSMGVKGLKKVSLDYMAGKCQSSEVGRPFVSWDSEEAKSSLLEHLIEYTYEEKAHENLVARKVPFDDESSEEYTDERIDEENKKFATKRLEEILYQCNISSEWEWASDLNNLDDPGKTLSDPDYWEWAYSVGKVPHTRLIIHHLAITMAIQQLTDKGRLV